MNSEQAHSVCSLAAATHKHINLNNGARSCHEASRPPESVAPQIRRWPLHGLPGDDKITHERTSAKRDWIRSELVEKYGGGWLAKGEEDIWKLRAGTREAIVELEEIENSHFNPARKGEFLSCGARKSWGTEVAYDDEERRITYFSCGEASCPRCYDRGKKRTLMDVHGFASASAQAQGVEKVYQQVFTLPDEIAHIPEKGTWERKELLRGIQRMQRKACGLRYRDGLAAYCCVHAVGDEDLFKNRFHFHAGFLPLASVKQRNGDFVIAKCDPGWTDAQWFKDQWIELINQVFPEHKFDMAVVNLQYVDMAHKDAAAILGHHLKYDGRGFGHDFELAPLAFHPIKRLVLIKAEKGGYEVKTYDDMASRWKWIRSQRDFRTWGILSQRKRYAELVGVEHVTEPEPEIKEENTVIVKRFWGKVWDREKRRVVWVDERRAYEPTSRKEIQNIEWGRKGGSEWRLVASPPQTHEGGKPNG